MAWGCGGIEQVLCPATLGCGRRHRLHQRESHDLGVKAVSGVQVGGCVGDVVNSHEAEPTDGSIEALWLWLGFAA